MKNIVRMVVGGVLLAVQAQAAEIAFTGGEGGTSRDLTLAANWGGTVPSGSVTGIVDCVTFGTDFSLSANTTFGGLRFEGAAGEVSVGGSQLTVPLAGLYAPKGLKKNGSSGLTLGIPGAATWTDSVPEGALTQLGWATSTLNGGGTLLFGSGAEWVASGSSQNYITEVRNLTVNQTGGRFYAGSFLQMGNEDRIEWNIADGLLSSEVMYLGFSEKTGCKMKLSQTGGTVEARWGFVLGNKGNGNSSAEYLLQNGTLNVNTAKRGNDAISGLVLAGNVTTGSSNPAGVFRMTGGTVNATNVRLGAQTGEFGAMNMGAINNGYAALDLGGGTFNLNGGITSSAGWNKTATNSSYRLLLRNGVTFKTAVDMTVPLKTDVPVSSAAATWDTVDKTVTLAAPLMGRGALVKRGTGHLTVRDATEFKGSLHVAEGTVDLLPVPQDEADDAVVWSGDTAAAVYADGESVVSWLDASGTRAAVSNETVWGGSKVFPAPKLTANAFNGHAGVTFAKSGLIIPKEANPTAKQKVWTIAFAFKMNANGSGGDGNGWCYQTGVLGNERPNVVTDWGLAYSGNGRLGFGLGMPGAGDRCVQSESGVSLNDGKVHVAVGTVNDGVVTWTVDGYLATLDTQTSQQARQDIPLFLGFHTLGTTGFSGTMAELRIYPGRALSELQASDVQMALMNKYGDTSRVASVERKRTSPISGAVTESVPVAAPTPSRRWTAESLAGSMADGAAVNSWSSEDGEVAATLANAGNLARAPVFAKGAFGAYDGVRFGGYVDDAASALGLAAKDSPVSGRTAFTCTAVVRTLANNLDHLRGGWYWGQYYACGALLSTKFGGDGADMTLGLAPGGIAVAGCGTAVSGGGNVSFCTANPCGLNDGLAHVLVYAFDAENKKARLMVDGVLHEKAFANASALTSSQKLLFGMMYGTASSLDERSRAFAGDVAEIRFHDAALSATDMLRETQALAVKYDAALPAKQLSTLEQLTVCGLGATNVTVAAGAKLRLPASDTAPWTVTSSRTLSGTGTVEGTVRYADGGLLDLTGVHPAQTDVWMADGAIIKPAQGTDVTTFARLRASGTVTVDVSDWSEPYERKTVLWRAVASEVDTVSWQVRGCPMEAEICLAEKDGVIDFFLHVRKGIVLIVR